MPRWRPACYIFGKRKKKIEKEKEREGGENWPNIFAQNGTIFFPPAKVVGGQRPAGGSTRRRKKTTENFVTTETERLFFRRDDDAADGKKLFPPFLSLFSAKVATNIPPLPPQTLKYFQLPSKRFIFLERGFIDQ